MKPIMDTWGEEIDREIAEGKRCGRRLELIVCANLRPCREHDLHQEIPELREDDNATTNKRRRD